MVFQVLWLYYLISHVLWLCDFGSLSFNYAILVLQISQLLQSDSFVIMLFLTTRTYAAQVSRLNVKSVSRVLHILLGLKMSWWQMDVFVTIGILGDQNCTIMIFERLKLRNWNSGTKIAQMSYMGDHNRAIKPRELKLHNCDIQETKSIIKLR